MTFGVQTSHLRPTATSFKPTSSLSSDFRDPVTNAPYSSCRSRYRRSPLSRAPDCTTSRLLARMGPLTVPATCTTAALDGAVHLTGSGDPDGTAAHVLGQDGALNAPFHLQTPRKAHGALHTGPTANAMQGSGSITLHAVSHTRLVERCIRWTRQRAPRAPFARKQPDTAILAQYAKMTAADINASRTACADVPCGNRLSYARLHGRRGSPDRRTTGPASASRRSRSGRG